MRRMLGAHRFPEPVQFEKLLDWSGLRIKSDLPALPSQRVKIAPRG